jgi:pyridoxal/pyridoxine/pyridoxamine kinase
MKATVENAKLLATLLAVIQKENSKAKDSLYEQLYAALQEDIDSQSGVKLLQIEGIEDPVPIQVFRGDKGDIGPQGKRGLIGEQGERGEQGIQGVQGPQGDPGRIGPQGLQGDKGDQGEKGDKGDAGRDGQDFDSSQLEKKFTELYDNFVRQISAQVTRMAYARGGMDMSGGGGEVRLEFLDDVNRNSAKQDGHFLKWDSASGKWIGDAANNFTTTIVTQDIIPAITNTYSLGSNTHNWKELYLSGNTMYIGGVAISADQKLETLKIGVNGKAQVLVTNAFITSTYMSNTDTRAFVLDEVAKVVNAAPTALNTLVEISTALGGDANFANTITTSINNKSSNAYVNELLSNTNSYIATKLDISDFQSALANTNSYIATKLDISDFQSALANTNSYIASVDEQRALDLSNTNAQIATINTTLDTKATNTYTQSVGISSATFTEANNTITFLRPDASELKLQINTSGGGSGNGDVSNAYLTSTYVANTEFQRVLANTNAYIASVVLSGNTTTISNANGSTGTSLIANNINSNVSLKRIKAGRNIEIEEVDGDIILTAIPQVDYGFISNDYGSISNPSTDGSVDYGTL